MTSIPETASRNLRSETFWWRVPLAATAANCVFQIAWFWGFRGHNINFDGIAYIGLAHHIVDGNFKASLHGYWSPLISWIIAASALFSRNFTLLGRLVTIASFLVCLPLLYLLTKKLWRSRVAAALAVFWFSLARGVVEESVGSIIADFLLTACVLLYFLLLLEALRRNSRASWFALGAAHALAFLAKAIAMPWLAISTVIAVLVVNARSSVFSKDRWRRLAACLLLAFTIPAAVWLGWGFTLRTKYGQFTTGYQLRANLRTNWTRKLSHRLRGDSLAFVDTSSLYDEYMVPETSWTELQSFNIRRAGMLTMLLEAEIRNIPAAIKEVVILLTPGGVLALVAMLLLLLRARSEYPAEVLFAGIALLNTVSVIVAYCMLVFDNRYVVPIIPVLIAISCPALLPAKLAPTAPHAASWLGKTMLALLIASIVFLTVYWASPFRTVDRDFEVSCYQAADLLRNAGPHGTLVSVGNGPYPEHGVGFEAGPYIAYLAGWREVAGNSELPDANGADELVSKILAAKSDAVAVWGFPSSPAYRDIAEKLQRDASVASASKITDPYKGEVGTLVLLRTVAPKAN
jgi:4-amino-4-deoxy-L-arabinose transferase-like glycosyltransferase